MAYNPLILTKEWDVERYDQDDGSITYEIWCYDPNVYDCITSINTDYDNDEDKLIAEHIVALEAERAKLKIQIQKLQEQATKIKKKQSLVTFSIRSRYDQVLREKIWSWYSSNN